MDVTLRSFRHDRQLARFVITGEPTGKVLGVGSFGSVEEVCIYSIFNDLNPMTIGSSTMSCIFFSVFYTIMLFAGCLIKSL